MPPKYAIQRGSVWHKSRLKSRDFYRNMAYGPQKYGIRTPHFMPYEPFLLGVGVVFNLLKLPLFCQPLSSLFALHGLRALDLLESKQTAGLRNRGIPLRDGPATTATILEFISRGPILHFLGVPLDDAPNAPSTQWNTEKRQRVFI